jgi:hypothetical protein
MVRSPVQGVLPKCLKGFIVSEVNSESEQAKRPDPCHEQLSQQVTQTGYSDIQGDSIIGHGNPGNNF